MPLLSLLFTVCILSGCACFQEPDFNKPLIVLPEDNDSAQNKQVRPENKEAKTPQQQLWVEAKTSRIWINPHIDENGDYVEGYYKYIVLEPGHWGLNANQTTKQ